MKTTARITGVLYLLLAVFGGIGFLAVRPNLFVAGDAAQTLQHLVANVGLARFGIAAELGTVVAQALAAVFFFKLFRETDVVSAMATAAFGCINAVVILGSAACLSVALAVTSDPSLAIGGDAARTVQLLYALSGSAWSVGGLFFGLWLMPMGLAALRSGVMPKALGWTLIVGGVGYLVSTLLGNVATGTPSWLADALVFPATIGELWMIGFLLVVGWKTPATNS